MPNSAKLIHAVSMVTRFAGASKKGYFWFSDKPEQKFNIVLRSDLAGNWELVAENIDNTLRQMCFAGATKDNPVLRKSN